MERYNPDPTWKPVGGVLTPLDSHAAIHCSVSCTRGDVVGGRSCGAALWHSSARSIEGREHGLPVVCRTAAQ